MNQPNHVISENLVISQPLYDNDQAAQSIYDKYLKDCTLIPIRLIEESQETQERPFAGTRQSSQQQQNQRNGHNIQEFINKLKRLKKQKLIINIVGIVNEEDLFLPQYFQNDIIFYILQIKASQEIRKSFHPLRIWNENFRLKHQTELKRDQQAAQIRNKDVTQIKEKFEINSTQEFLIFLQTKFDSCDF